MKKPFKIPQFLRGVIRIIAFFIVSICTVLYALGYKINVQTKSFEQTGIIKVDSKVTDTAQVYLNGQKVSDLLPYRKAYVFPGVYDLKLTKDGFQDVSYRFTVVKNKVNNYPNATQIYTTPKNIAQDTYSTTFSTSAKAILNPDLEKNGNELWFDGKYVTRFSKTIYSASLFPDNAHLVLQLGNQLVLMDEDGRNHQIILTADDSLGLIQYIYKENGRIIQYYNGKVLKSIELYPK